MYEFLSHLLDPAAPHWPGTPAVAATQDTEIGDECPYASWTMTVPNHFGTHMDAPRHFVPGGIKITDLPIEYFTHDRVLFIEFPKGDAEGVMPEDLKPYEEEIKKVSCLLIRTGYEKYRTEDPTRYGTLSPHVHPETCKYLVETFPDHIALEEESIFCLPDPGFKHFRPFMGKEFIRIFVRFQIQDPDTQPRILQQRNRAHGSFLSGTVAVVGKDDLLCETPENRYVAFRQGCPQ